MKYVIFDFNRTLFDPDENRLLPGALEVLEKLRQQKILLFLIAQAFVNRQELIAKLGLKKSFERIILVKNKDERLFESILSDYQIDPLHCFVVGDRVKKEIAFGKRCGCTTVWLRAGKFAGELPVATEEFPDYTITNLGQLLPIVLSN